MGYTIQRADIEVLRNAGKTEVDIAHSVHAAEPKYGKNAVTLER